jgi:hypothetical protein
LPVNCFEGWFLTIAIRRVILYFYISKSNLSGKNVGSFTYLTSKTKKNEKTKRKPFCGQAVIKGCNEKIEWR